MIYGADPSIPMSQFGWESGREFSPRVRRLINYFAFPECLRMSQRCNGDWEHPESGSDKFLVGVLFSRRLEQGYSFHALEKMVDRFYQMWAGEYSIPALAFVSTTVQTVLTNEAEVIVDDPYLEWLLLGMPSVCPLFDSPAEIRKAVLTASSELTHRYPDVVANVLRLKEPHEPTVVLLWAAFQLMHWHLGLTTDDQFAHREILKSVVLPKELNSRRRSSRSIRVKHETLAQAVGAIPLKKGHERKRQECIADESPSTWYSEQVSAPGVPMWV